MKDLAARAIRLIVCLLALAAFTPRSTAAHPSVSVVVTPDGRVYFSDLERVWAFEPDGAFRVAVPDVHAHELRLGADGALYGEDVRNRGDVYRVRYWRLTPAGRIEHVTDWIAGHPSDIGFSLMEPADTGRYWVRLTGGEVRLIRRDGTVDVKFQLDAESVPASWVEAIPGGALVVRGVRSGRYAVDPGVGSTKSATPAPNRSVGCRAGIRTAGLRPPGARRRRWPPSCHEVRTS